MMEQIRAVIQAASQVTEVPRRRAEELARELTGGSSGRSSVASLAEEIVRRSRENAAMVQALVSSEIRRQVKALGLATRDDLERLERRLTSSPTARDLAVLERRLEDLEKGARKKPSPSRGSSKGRTTSKKQKT